MLLNTTLMLNQNGQPLKPLKYIGLQCHLKASIIVITGTKIGAITRAKIALNISATFFFIFFCVLVIQSVANNGVEPLTELIFRFNRD